MQGAAQSHKAKLLMVLRERKLRAREEGMLWALRLLRASTRQRSLVPLGGASRVARRWGEQRLVVVACPSLCLLLFGTVKREQWQAFVAKRGGEQRLVVGACPSLCLLLCDTVERQAPSQSLSFACTPASQAS